MIKLKKSVRLAFSLSLLLYFTAVTLSLDFFHDHSGDISCTDLVKHGACSHKSHFSHDSTCWICIAHLQKEAITSAPAGILPGEIPCIRISPEHEIEQASVKPIAILLRGPPAIPSSI